MAHTLPNKFMQMDDRKWFRKDSKKTKNRKQGRAMIDNIMKEYGTQKKNR